MRSAITRASLVLGAVLLVFGAFAGVVNRQVLDGPAFARHVDSIRADPAVSRLVAAAVTDQVLATDPDLVAVRPLVDAAAAAVVRSPAFSPLVQAATRSLHSALTEPGSGSVVLRVADLGAVLVPALRAVAPDAARRLPDTLEVTLARTGDQTFASRTIRLTRTVHVAAWLLPTFALACFGLSVWLAADRRRAVVRTGMAVTLAGGVVALVTAGVGLDLDRHDSGRLSGALLRAGWSELEPSLWRTSVVVALTGVVLAVGAQGVVAASDVRPRVRHVAGFVAGVVARRPESRALQLLRAAVAVTVGALAVLHPRGAMTAGAVLAGAVLLVLGVIEAAAAIGAPAPAEPETPPRSSRHRTMVTAAGAAVLLLAGLVAYASRPPRALVDAAATVSAVGCNGSVVLCGRRYDEVAFPATHNSMSAADQPGWFFPEQPDGIVAQLRAGIRVLLFDTWDGAPTSRAGVVTTASSDRAAALAEANETYGAEVVASALRTRKAIGLAPTGPSRPYLCHNLCELGSTLWEPVMVDVAAWMRAHPREVVTFFIQDEVSPADTAAILDRAGLLPFVFTQHPGQAWPTLGQMIDSGHRLVVLMEHRGGGTQYPWLLQGFDWVQDTPYTFNSVAEFTCAANRGPASASLLLVNHWLSNFATRVSDADVVNSRDVLLPRLERCGAERHHIPNFVAVDFYDRGDLFGVVDELNGIG